MSLIVSYSCILHISSSPFDLDLRLRSEMQIERIKKKAALNALKEVRPACGVTVEYGCHHRDAQKSDKFRSNAILCS